MKSNANGEFRSRVYLDRPPYADFDAPAKFEAIKNKVGKDKEYVKERFADIERMITILEKDANEVV